MKAGRLEVCRAATQTGSEGGSDHGGLAALGVAPAPCYLYELYIYLGTWTTFRSYSDVFGALRPVAGPRKERPQCLSRYV